MMQALSPPMPPKLERQGPTLETLHMVERLLRAVDRPMSLNEIKSRLPRKVMHQTLRHAIEHYKRLGCVAEGSKGVMWVLYQDPAFWAMVSEWRKV